MDNLESAVLAYAMNGEYLNMATMGIGQGHFGDIGNKMLWMILSDIARTGAPITMTEIIQRCGNVKAVGVAYAKACEPSISARWNYFAQKLNEAYLVREQKILFSEGMDILSKADINSSESVETTLSALELLKRKKSDSHATRSRSCAEVDAIMLDDIVADMMGGRSQIPTGIEPLNRAIGGGWSKGKLVTIAARSGIGKTSLATYFACKALEGGANVLFYTNEMRDTQIREKCLSQLARIPHGVIKDRTFTDDQLEAFEDAVTTYQLPMRIDYTTGTEWTKLEAAMISDVRKYGINLVIIDYIQQYKIASMREKRSTNRTIELGEISGRAKELAMELDTTVMILAQLNRNGETGANGIYREPTSANIRDSDSIVHDSDIILILSKKKPVQETNQRYAPSDWQHSRDDEDDEDALEYFLTIDKNREGPGGKQIPLDVDFQFNDFKVKR